jgi:hypothetical protein
LPPISLERTLQVLLVEDRKSMSSDYFSVLVILILHRFDLYSKFFIVFFFKKKWGIKCREYYFFVSWHVRYCMYFCLISQFIAH